MATIMATMTTKLKRQHRTDRLSRRDAATLRSQRNLLAEVAERWDELVGRSVRLFVMPHGSPIDGNVPLSYPGKRPLLLMFECRPDGRILMAGSFARWNSASKELVYTRIFQYDIALPFAVSHEGAPAEGLLLRKRELVTAALAALRAFVREQPSAFVTMPEVHCDTHGRLYEDFSKVMGVEVPNPTVNCWVDVSMPNPAQKIFAARGVDAEDVAIAIMADGAAANEFVAEFKAKIGPVADVIPEEYIADALVMATPQFRFRLPVPEAFEHFPEDCVEAVRESLLPWQKIKAAYSDIRAAVENPTAPLKISGLSRPAVFDADKLELSEGYAGDPMPTVSFMPKNAEAAILVAT